MTFEHGAVIAGFILLLLVTWPIVFSGLAVLVAFLGGLVTLIDAAVVVVIVFLWPIDKVQTYFRRKKWNKRKLELQSRKKLD